MKVAFWLLDINSETKNGAPEIWLWGINEAGKRVLVIDRLSRACFYALVKESADPSQVADEIRNRHSTSITDLELAPRRLFGRPVNAIKVFCISPDDVSKCARELREFEGVEECFEDDIRYSMHYLVDNSDTPCGWHEVEAVEVEGKPEACVDKTYVAKSPPKPVERTEPPKLRIMGFSTIRYGRKGSPKPERDPVVIISTASNFSDAKQFVADNDGDDMPVIEAFVKHVQACDPDIIAGYGSNEHEWPYLIERSKQLGLKLHVDRACMEPHMSVYSHVSLTGRASLDLADYAEEFPEVKVKTLENLADYLGAMKLNIRTVIEEVDFAEYWDDADKRGLLVRFSADSADCVMGVAEAVLDFALQLSNLVGLPLDHVGTAAAGFRVEWFLIKRTHELGELVPKRVEQPYRPYAGGLVLQPKPGLHESIADLDFKSMYPNLMINYNLSPDTYVAPKDPSPVGGVYEAPEVKHRFRKEPPGFYKEVLTYLINARNEIRVKMKALDARSGDYRVLDARQKAVKIITNAAYGYVGWTGARWFVKPVAEAAAAWGRYTISEAIKMAERNGLQVVYGDTDSIFVNNDEATIAHLEEEIESKLGLEVGLDKVYVRIFFTEAKKRYAGLLPDGRLDIVGLEVMRGDWSAVAKDVQEKVLEIILKNQSPQKALEYVQAFIRDLRQKRVRYRDLIIWKTLTKPAEEYQVKASHVEAARMLREKGWELAVGDKIGYVVVAGSGRLYERVKPHVLATYPEVDIEYYVSKQVVPAAARILESFGITEEQLLKSSKHEKESRKITDFLGG